MLLPSRVIIFFMLISTKYTGSLVCFCIVTNRKDVISTKTIFVEAIALLCSNISFIFILCCTGDFFYCSVLCHSMYVCHILKFTLSKLFTLIVINGFLTEFWPHLHFCVFTRWHSAKRFFPDGLQEDLKCDVDKSLSQKADDTDDRSCWTVLQEFIWDAYQVLWLH